MKSEKELPWDLVDRCFLPVVFSNAASVIVATLLNTLRISNVSSFSLFLIFLILAVGTTLFYHNLKVTALGKVVVISGCESKLGYAIAKHLDDLGLTVFAGFSGHESEREKLKEESSGRLKVIDLDVSSHYSIAEAVQTVQQGLGSSDKGVWGLINCASWAAFGEVEWVPLSVFRRSLDINVLGAIAFTQAFLPLLKKTKGRIINISSVYGHIPSGVRSPFCLAKSALTSFTECLRIELKRWGTDVISIEPGHITTGSWFENKKMLQDAREMWGSMSEESRKECGESYFEQRIRALKEYSKQAECDFTPILRSVGDAVTRTFPMPQYTPVTKEEKLEILISQHCPRSVYEIIYK